MAQLQLHEREEEGGRFHEDIIQGGCLYISGGVAGTENY